MKYTETAIDLDQKDPLKNFRAQFYIPQYQGNDVAYFCGNSLGLQPIKTKDYILQELNDWAEHGVEGHFRAKNPWLTYHEMFAEPLSKLVGSKTSEVVCMNQLTVNLNLLMSSFYRPTAKRFKIICEAKAFPSDQYAFALQAQYHGFSPDDAIVEVHPREGEFAIRISDIIQTIENEGESVALVLFSGINYYTGQLFDMQAITQVAHRAGAYCGFDLAHAIGNVSLSLHDWDADFATWCSYKYLNSGPGGVSGIYVHERFHGVEGFPAFAGWWGHDKETRFKMDKTFVPIHSAEAWQMSNAPVFSMAAHKASLDIFMDADFKKLQSKRKALHSFLRTGLADLPNAMKQRFTIITPKNQDEHGCQVSLLFSEKGKAIFDYLSQKGIVADWREPNVIRVAPVPLYNSFNDIARLLEALATFDNL